jgi:hypothetical protein
MLDPAHQLLQLRGRVVPAVLSEETSLLGLWLLGCWVARLGFTAVALEDSNLCPQILSKGRQAVSIAIPLTMPTAPVCGLWADAVNGVSRTVPPAT